MLHSVYGAPVSTYFPIWFVASIRDTGHAIYPHLKSVLGLRFSSVDAHIRYLAMFQTPTLDEGTSEAIVLLYTLARPSGPSPPIQISIFSVQYLEIVMYSQIPRSMAALWLYSMLWVTSRLGVILIFTVELNSNPTWGIGLSP